eukprot:SAG31_NODE_3339_length_4386_cov_39.128528_5_plen_60_part_00
MALSLFRQLLGCVAGLLPLGLLPRMLYLATKLEQNITVHVNLVLGKRTAALLVRLYMYS